MKRRMFGKWLSLLTAVALCLSALSLHAGASGINDGMADATAEKIYNCFGPENAELDGTTVKIIRDFALGENDPDIEWDGYGGGYLWVDSMAEDITLDLNGHTISDAYIAFSGDPERTLTVKDSVGTGKLITGDWMSPLSTAGINLTIEGGTFIGTAPVENIPNCMGVEALGASGNVIKILGGEFYGGTSWGFGCDAITIGDAETVIIGDGVIAKGGSQVPTSRYDYDFGDYDYAADSLIGCGISFYNEAEIKQIEIGAAIITGGSKEYDVTPDTRPDSSVGGNGIYSENPINMRIDSRAEISGGVDVDPLDAINVPDGSVIEWFNRPITKTENGVTVSAGAGVFPDGAEIGIRKLTSGAAYDRAAKAAAELAKQFSVFEITAILNGAAVQPDGTVDVTFAIPAGYNADRLALYYIPESGDAEQIALTVDRAAGTATARLNHFSTYLLAETAGAATSPKTGDRTVIFFWSVLLTAAALGGVGLYQVTKYPCKH